MACDLCFTQSGSIQWKGKTKIYKFPPHEDTYPECGFIVGFAGPAGDIITAIDFFNDPDSYKKVPTIRDTTGLVLTEKGDLFLFDHIGKWIRMNAPYASIGSGSPFAMGVMANGGTVKQAIKAATKHDPFTGMGIKVLSW